MDDAAAAQDAPDLRALADIRDRLEQIIDALRPSDGAEFRQWRPAPKPPPALMPTERRDAELARLRVMADIRRHPARGGNLKASVDSESNH